MTFPTHNATARPPIRGLQLILTWARHHTAILHETAYIQEELFEELRAQGFEVHPGRIGENITGV